MSNFSKVATVNEINTAARKKKTAQLEKKKSSILFILLGQFAQVLFSFVSSKVTDLMNVLFMIPLPLQLPHG